MKNCAYGAGRRGAKNAIGQLAADVPSAWVGIDDNKRHSQFGMTDIRVAITVITSFANGCKLPKIVTVESDSVETEMELCV